MNPNLVRYKRNTLKDLFKTSQRKTYTTLGVTIILVVFLAVIAIRPTIIKVGEIQNDIKAKEALKVELESKLKLLTELDQKYRDYEQVVPLLDQAIPAKSDTASLTANISELVKSFGMTLNSIQFTSSTAAISGNQGIGISSTQDNVSLIKITLAIDGTYNGLKSFTKAIEEYPRPMHISRFSISTPQVASGSKVVSTENISINLDMYTLQKLVAIAK